MSTKAATYKLKLLGEWGDSKSVDHVANYLDVTYGRSRTGIDNPKWRVQVSDGLNAGTPFTGWVQDVFFHPCNFELGYDFRLTVNSPWTSYVSRAVGLVNYQNNIPQNQYLGGNKVAEANAAAVKKLYRKLKKVRSQFAGGIVLGELHKTVDLIARPASTLRHSIMKFLKRTRGNGWRQGTKDWSKAIADAYLEETFGWEPLLQDISDGAKALRRLKGKDHPLRFKVKASEVTVGTLTGTEAHLGITQSRLVVSRDADVKREDTVVYYGAFKESVLRAISDDRLQRIIDLSGFSWRDVVPTAWELLPWSFLVDYFTNIGDLLEALSTDTSVVGWLSKVTVSETVHSTTFELDRAATQAALNPLYYRVRYLSGSTGTTICKYRSVSREVNLAVPNMLFQWETPGLWSRKTLNLVALLRSSSARFR